MAVLLLHQIVSPNTSYSSLWRHPPNSHTLYSYSMVCWNPAGHTQIRISSSGASLLAASIIPAGSIGEKQAHTQPSTACGSQSTSPHTASPADTIHQRPPKSNAANWKVMTAKGLLDLHANSSILASHSQATGKMRLSASFQTISCLLFHSTQAHIPIYFLLALLSWSQKSAGDCITRAFQKSQPRTARGNMFLSSHWDRAADCSCRWALKHPSSTADDYRAEHFLQAGLQLPCAFYARAYNGFSALVSCRIVELCFEYPTSTTVLPLASALALSLPIISFKCQQHTRHTEI